MASCLRAGDPTHEAPQGWLEGGRVHRLGLNTGEGAGALAGGGTLRGDDQERLGTRAMSQVRYADLRLYLSTDRSEVLLRLGWERATCSFLEGELTPCFRTGSCLCWFSGALVQNRA